VNRRVRIGISLGDPGGVGPETAAKAVLAIESGIDFVFFCDQSFIEIMARRFRWAVELLEFADRHGNIGFAGAPQFDGPAPFGRPTPPGGEFAYWSVIDAARAALAGQIDALVTAPLSKAGLNLAGHDYPGYTELLRNISEVERVVMMLLAGDFRVIPATRHVPIMDIPLLITRELISNTIRITVDSLKKYESIERPRVGVLALNPHGGENGLLGNEETTIKVAIGDVLGEGYDIEGPLVPDIAFIPRFRKRYDAIIGMYHDQVLIPLKMAGFECAVNATLGLPFVRTSPGHGTAYDIAGTDSADPSSFIEAIKLAIKWVEANEAE